MSGMVGRRIFCTMLAAAWLTRWATAADPQLARITPYGAQRAAEVETLLTGARLADAQEILFYEPGLRVVKLETQKDGSVKARLAVAADSPLGVHGLRLRTASGISNLILFSVGTLPEIQETEPNNDFGQPQKIPLNVTVNGTVENEDVDHFLIEAKKGQRITAEIEGIRLGQTFFDPFLAILDMNRFALAEADDTPLVRQDCVVSIIAPNDGTYVIQVRESAFGGSGDCRYRLHVGTFPRPTAVYPAGGRPGENLEVRWLGDVAGEWTEKVTLPTAPQLAPSLVAHDAQGSAPSANPIRVIDLPNVLETEPNENPASVALVQVPAALNGVISKPGDVDYFKFAAKTGQVFDIRVHARSLRSALDPVLGVLRSNGAGVAGNDDTDTPDAYVRFTAPADDQYLIVVYDQLRQGRPDYVYRIEVTAVRPKLTLGLPERDAFVDVSAPVPAGNRVAVLVSAQREDFGSEVKLELAGLPPGLSAEIAPIVPGDPTVPLLLSAAADAKPTGAMVDVIGRANEGGRAVEGHLLQRTSLVRGANNREIVNHYTERLAAAVTQATAFAIEIVEPKVPLVQSGSMDLKIVAKRQPNFKAPITLRMLYNPPGVSSPSSVTIPEGKDEVLLPLTADGGAVVRKWKIAVTGEATVGDGTVLVSTQLANLEVAEPFVKFALPTVSVDQGQQTELVVKVEKKKDFPGSAPVELVGLPNEATSAPQPITKDSTEARFPIKTTAKSPVGQHKTLLCRAVLMLNNEPITHLQGTGELRIQLPLPAKPVEAKPAPAPPPKAEPAKSEKKPQSRLELLRQERKTAQPAEKK